MYRIQNRGKIIVTMSKLQYNEDGNTSNFVDIVNQSVQHQGLHFSVEPPASADELIVLLLYNVYSFK